jgi:exodeoxyribonuclease VII large subunit
MSKKNNNSKKIIYENSSDFDSDELSDELNSMINNTSKQIKKEITKETEYFDVNIVYSDIVNTLNKHKFCELKVEIINLKISDNNAWINIKSDEFQTTAIFWKITQNINYDIYKTLDKGDQVILKGNFGIMKKNLSIYFNIKSIQKFGKGDYLDIYENYRIKIKQNNLGFPKKKLSGFPYNIGIITALGGAAIQDILQTFKSDYFIGNIIIKNSIVQGNQCPKSIINSIEWFESNYDKQFKEFGQLDILMITRGGGGWEDLVGFSDWELLTKISNTKFITLSAVGHQIDNQLSDEVADYKYPTPSLGAKFITETQQLFKNNLKNYIDSLNKIINNYLDAKNYLNSYIEPNYGNIIKKHDIKNMLSLVKSTKFSLENILNKFNNVKNKFFTQLTNMKPTIIRKKELTSIQDFVSTNNEELNNKPKSKKIDIYFIDGRVKISYKVIDYEEF